MLFKVLADDFSFPSNDWKDRFKDFSEKMAHGYIFEAADVLKHLTYLSHLKPLFISRTANARSGSLSGEFLNWPRCAASRNATSNHALEQALTRACVKHERRPARARAAAATAGHLTVTAGLVVPQRNSKSARKSIYFFNSSPEHPAGVCFGRSSRAIILNLNQFPPLPMERTRQ